MSKDIVFELRPHQEQVIDNLRRFNVLLAHRRFGKTVLAVMLLINKALTCKHDNARVHYFSPTYAQSKRVAWDYVKQYGQLIPGTVFNESELKADFINGARLQLGSADNPDASRGIYSDFAVLDEPAQMPPSMWTEVLRPALSDRRGGALFIGTPKGRHGLFYDIYQAAVDDPNWWRGAFKASDTGIVAQAELDAALKTMSLAEFNQEFELDWAASIKGAYYGEKMTEIEADDHITNVLYQPQLPVHCSLDLGYNDATAIFHLQIDGMRVNLIDYDEYTNMGLPDITAELKRKPWEGNYGKMIVPHDAGHHSLSTGETRDRTMRELGWDTIMVTRCAAGMLNKEIEITRNFLTQCWFDKTKCKDGIEALRQYSSKWKDKEGVLSLAPQHDWASHGSDSMRYLAMCGIKRIVGQWESRPRAATERISHAIKR